MASPLINDERQPLLSPSVPDRQVALAAGSGSSEAWGSFSPTETTSYHGSNSGVEDEAPLSALLRALLVDSVPEFYSIRVRAHHWALGAG
ncbi:hypothetical protein BD414DRAFT_120814 [Trametes punicea]|nr:hypothetical protein BD414DRAFT_120814 [Trametes punicea]